MVFKQENTVSVALPLQSNCPWNVTTQEQLFYCLVMLLEEGKKVHSNDSARYFWLARHRFNSCDLPEWYNYDINFHHVA